MSAAKTARLVRSLEGGWSGDARLYELSEPHEGYSWDEDEEAPSFKHVIVSACVALYSGPETYIFGADERGTVLSWTEMPGSFKGALDHAEALRGAGYEVVS